MKKSVKTLAVGLCGALVFSAAAGFSACGKEDNLSADKVYLKAMTGPQAVGTMEADYFLLAEPAVTAQSKNGFFIKGDLQALYGGENGYPQAVLVAKTELLTSYPGWVEHYFINQITKSAAWLETASGAEVVSAVSSHMADEDYATTLKAPLLTADVMARCGVWFAHAWTSSVQTEVKTFLSEMLTVNDKAAAMPTDEFFWGGGAFVSSAYPPENEVTVYMPDGAPALALAKIMSEDTAEDGVTYKVVDPSLISSVLTYEDESKNADMCVLPVTAASKLLGKGDRYKMVGVVTHGNLFLISKDGEALTAENLASLKGKTIGVLNISQVPGLTLKAVLNKYDIPFEEVKAV
ncbi:MAG: hypothetical protein IJ308_08335 [Clostridia bacterium]|nr:hypothetical protein [Clostridia bacterium]MBQ7913726.1 hypothetical protein [Clostridia bacterium]